MTAQTIVLLLCIGFIAGVLSGLVGIGGGIIIVPALIYLLGYGQHVAQGTSLGLLMFPVGILAVFNYYRKGFIDTKAIAVMAGAFLIGGLLGSKLSLSVSDVLLKKIFAVSLIVIAVKMLFFDK